MLRGPLLASGAYIHLSYEQDLLMREGSSWCMQKHSDHGNGKAAPPELLPSEPSSRPGSPDCKDSSSPCRDEPSSGHEQGQSGQFSSLIGELAEKYGCGSQDDTLLEEDEGGAREERTFMTPQVRASQEKFTEALQLAIQVINCRSQLLKHLRETQC